ncbi:hypothetical protein [Caloramator proteoclasticus]|uniref:TM2 domain-containing protein n=1 Tax=Caloramator proteoclasticus DSM 10124 TaxID=1121262 RepID=A0A1M4Z7Y8_9CLOT|nr:hypothetical protein [Caloramator proteoclasticus]SHF13716.1 hypothetical protein SAMN02746091_01845 [Caloramator proteoclasticus DSM 10124]
MRRNSLSTFIAALIPGVGYMYLGLYRKGLEALALFLLIKPVFSLFGLGVIGGILQFFIWIYAFVDTFKTASLLDAGKYVEDDYFIFSGFYSKDAYGNRKKIDIRYLINTLAVLLILAGVFSIVNKAFGTNELYIMVKSFVRQYFIPVVMVLGGFYLLLQNRR